MVGEKSDARSEPIYNGCGGNYTLFVGDGLFFVCRLIGAFVRCILGYDERKDLFDDEFEVVDLDEDEGVRGPRRWWTGLVQGQRFSRRSSLALLALSMVGLLAVGGLLWPNLVLISQSLLPRPVVQASDLIVRTRPKPGQGPVVSTFSLGDMMIAKIFIPLSGSGARIVALRHASGQVAWESQATILNMGVEDGKLWVQEQDHSLNGISGKDGSLIWRTGLSGDTQVLAALGGLLYVEDSQQRLSAYQIADGSLQWRYDGGGAVLAVDQGLVYVEHILANSGPFLTALRVGDGKVVWQSTSLKALPVRVLVANGVVYSYGEDAGLTAVRVRDNRVLWRRALQQRDRLEAVAAGMVYVASDQNSTVMALNGQTGAPLWRYTLGGTSVVAVRQQVIYLKTDQSVTALNTNKGTLIWHYETSASISDVQIQDGRMYAISGLQGIVNAISIRDGDLLWHYDIGDDSSTSAQPQGYVARIEQGVVYVVLNHDISLNAVRVLDKEKLWHTSLATR